MIRVSRGSPGDSSMMPLSMCIRVLLTFRRAKLKHNNRVNDISHALALLHTVDDNLQGTLQDRKDDRLGVSMRKCDGPATTAASISWLLDTITKYMLAWKREDRKFEDWIMIIENANRSFKDAGHSTSPLIETASKGRQMHCVSSPHVVCIHLVLNRLTNML